jgi:Endoglucanase
MKRTKISTILLLVLLARVSLMAQPVKEHGQLWVDGTQLKDKNGKAVVLRGISYGWHNWWPRFYNAGTVKWLSNDWGCSVLRLAIGVEPDSGYIKQPNWSRKLLTTSVDAAIKEGVYVIIDWHSHNIRLDEAKAFFTDMAQTYGKYPNIIYELFNEPDKETWPEVKAYSTELIATIRKYDANNVILVGNPHWDQDVNIVADDPITGYKNIMYTLHFYAATHKQWLRDRADYALKKGIPLFVSECSSMFANGNGKLDYTEMQAWIDWMEKAQISWAIWSVADKNETCSMIKPTASSQGKWSEADLTESGYYDRKLIRGFNVDRK